MSGPAASDRRGPAPPIGILTLDTRFPRVPGDAGRPETWPFPVLVRRVPGATPDRVVEGRAAGLLDAFAEAGAALVRDGARGILTTCGFLVLHQRELGARLPVPLMTSSLLQIPALLRLLPAGRRVGVVTVSAAALGAEHLRAAGAPADTPVAGIRPGSHFARVFLGNAPALDPAEAAADVVEAACDLVAASPEIGALVLECANMGPYAAAVRDATGRPVFDAVSAGTWFAAGLDPRRFEPGPAA